MKTKELIEYLQSKTEESDIRILIVNPKARKFYPATGFGVICDYPYPVLAVEVGDPEPFDEELMKAAEEDEANAETDA